MTVGSQREEMHAVLELLRMGTSAGGTACWCGMAIDDPRVRHHSMACLGAQRLYKTLSYPAPDPSPDRSEAPMQKAITLLVDAHKHFEACVRRWENGPVEDCRELSRRTSEFLDSQGVIW